jgi:hypothetical protein
MGRAEAILRNSWFLGGLVAVAAWNVVFLAPTPGNDGSWVVGLYLAAREGLRFGEELIFTYGPLGFLAPLAPEHGSVAVVADDSRAVLAFLYGATLHLALCASLVWALRRWLHPAAAVLVAFALVAGFPAMQRPYVLAAIWCLSLLASEPPAFTRPLVIFGGGAFAAIESLIRLTTGPVIAVMCVAALAAARRRRRGLGAFAATYAGVLALLWFASGQALSNVPEFVSGGFQIVTGYSQAMADAEPGLKWDLAVGAGALVVVVLAAAAVLSGAPGRRLAAAIAIGIPAFAAFKEGMVREDPPHLSILFATALGLALALPWRGGWRLGAAPLAVGLAVLAAVPAAGFSLQRFDPTDHADRFADGLDTVLSEQRRERLADDGRVIVTALSALDEATLRLLRGHSVHADPSGASVVWAYDLDWRPLPVFQENAAYTSYLDERNADFLVSGAGPERVLRGTPQVVDPFSQVPVDDRNPAWNPPAVNLAFLCSFRSLRATESWQVLARAPDRCGDPRLIRSVESGYGEPIEVPRAGRNEAVFARIEGVEVSGLERLRSALFRARVRELAINDGEGVYRLVPATADDELILSVPAGLDFPAPFALTPEPARTLELRGAGGELRIDFYALPLEPGSTPRKGSIRSAPVNSNTR